MEAKFVVSAIREVLQYFYRNETEEAYHHLVRMIDLLASYIAERMSGAQYESLLVRLMVAMENRDSITICDLLQYELIPMVNGGLAS